MKVPLFKVHMPDAVFAPLRETLQSGWIASGLQVAEFERLLSDVLAAPRILAVSDCSGAITLALFLAGVRPNDEVIVSPMSCLSTTTPIANLFANPVWCDVDPLTGMLDPARIDEAVSPRTRAILVYHWSGDPADLSALSAAARSHSIKLVADASEAFGATYRGKPLGHGPADFTVYSFGAVRHLTTGEGAALVISDGSDYEAGKWLRRYGIHQPTMRLPNGDLNPAMDIAVAGFNFPMNDIAASIGIAQLPHAARIVARHRVNGRYYDEQFAEVPGVIRLRRDPQVESAFWTYSLRVERRGELMRKLHEQEISCQRLHLRNDRYACFSGARATALPGVEVFDRDNLSIPCGWWVSDEDRERIAGCIRSGW